MLYISVLVEFLEKFSMNINGQNHFFKNRDKKNTPIIKNTDK